MKNMSIGSLFALLFCTGCGVQQLIDETTCATYRSQAAMIRATELIKENNALMVEVNAGLQENKRNLEMMTQ